MSEEKSAPPQTAPVRTWLILVAATFISFLIGHDHESAAATRIAAISVIVIALWKCRLIILDFMEVRAASPPLRLLLEAWVFLLCAALIATYLFAAPANESGAIRGCVPAEPQASRAHPICDNADAA